jgi:hypothetical protein
VLGFDTESLKVDEFNVASTNTLLSHIPSAEFRVISDQELSQFIYIDMEVYDMSRTRGAIIPT